MLLPVVMGESLNSASVVFVMNFVSVNFHHAHVWLYLLEGNSPKTETASVLLSSELAVLPGIQILFKFISNDSTFAAS